MTYKRARTMEQKSERIQQIIEATLAIYAAEGYDAVTFSKISKGLSFCRFNLYNYFKSKEDIFLLIILQDIREMVEDARKSFPAPEPSQEAFADKWCEMLLRHQRLLALFSIVNTIILRGTSPHSHESYRIKMYALFQELYKIVQRALPQLTLEQAATFVEYENSFAMTIFPASVEYKASQSILILPDAGYGTNHFTPQFKPFLLFILQGLTEKK